MPTKTTLSGVLDLGKCDKCRAKLLELGILMDSGATKINMSVAIDSGCHENIHITEVESVKE